MTSSERQVFGCLGILVVAAVGVATPVLAIAAAVHWGPALAAAAGWPTWVGVAACLAAAAALTAGAWFACVAAGLVILDRMWKAGMAPPKAAEPPPAPLPSPAPAPAPPPSPPPQPSPAPPAIDPALVIAICDEARRLATEGRNVEAAAALDRLAPRPPSALVAHADFGFCELLADALPRGDAHRSARLRLYDLAIAQARSQLPGATSAGEAHGMMASIHEIERKASKARLD